MAPSSQVSHKHLADSTFNTTDKTGDEKVFYAGYDISEENGRQTTGDFV